MDVIKEDVETEIEDVSAVVVDSCDEVDVDADRRVLVDVGTRELDFDDVDT